MSVIDKLEEKFSSFPGIGPRQAKRFVYYLLSRRGVFIDELIFLLENLKKDSKQCSSCFRYFAKEHDNGTPLCSICGDRGRNASVLMVVLKDTDIEPIERSSVFNGVYFVLGGILPVLEENPEKRIRIKALEEKIKKDLKDEKLSEVILAFPVSPDGDNTTEFIEKRLKAISKESDLKISKLARGLSTGLEIEYSDGETIKNAFKGRG